MEEPRLTLTTVGLSVRDQLRVKSMLQLVAGKTSATWTYVDEPQADLAICEPDSALARVVMEQASQHGGRPRCVSLLRPGAKPMEDTQSVYAPLRVSDFISILNATFGSDGAEGIDSSLTTQQLVAAAHAEAIAHNEGFLLAHSLRDIIARADSLTYRVTHGRVVIYVMPAQDSVFSNEELTTQLITTLACASGGLHTQELPANVVPAFEGGFHRRSLHYLTWNCGLLGATSDLLPWLPRMARFRVSRWPDFGRLGHQPWQVRLTSILMNNAYTLQQMTGLVQQPIANIRAFLNACSLCGLLTHEALPIVETFTAPAKESAPVPGSSRWSGLLHSLRNALRSGDE